MSDGKFHNLYRICKAHQTNAWWIMRVFRLHCSGWVGKIGLCGSLDKNLSCLSESAVEVVLAVKVWPLTFWPWMMNVLWRTLKCSTTPRLRKCPWMLPILSRPAVVLRSTIHTRSRAIPLVYSCFLQAFVQSVIIGGALRYPWNETLHPWLERGDVSGPFQKIAYLSLIVARIYLSIGCSVS